MISAGISPVTSCDFTLSQVIDLKVFTEYKNLVLGTFGPATSSYITTDNAQLYRFINKLSHPGQMPENRSARYKI